MTTWWRAYIIESVGNVFDERIKFSLGSLFSASMEDRQRSSIHGTCGMLGRLTRRRRRRRKKTEQRDESNLSVNSFVDSLFFVE